jgi:hypothetical protein
VCGEFIAAGVRPFVVRNNNSGGVCVFDSIHETTILVKKPKPQNATTLGGSVNEVVVQRTCAIDYYNSSSGKGVVVVGIPHPRKNSSTWIHIFDTNDRERFVIGFLVGAVVVETATTVFNVESQQQRQ